jgi:hypothetical protein
MEVSRVSSTFTISRVKLGSVEASGTNLALSSSIVRTIDLEPDGRDSRMEPQTVMSGDRTEDTFTKQVEDYTATIPSSAYLGVAIAAMALSLALEVGGRGKWGNFIAQWVPTWLIIGLYNKVVKLEGHDHIDRD